MPENPYGKIEELERQCTNKQLLFARYYAAGNNQTESAIAAGYSKSTAVVQASRLLTNVKVLRLIDALRFENRILDSVDRERKLQHLSHVMQYGEYAQVISAIRVHNQMTGDDKSMKVDKDSDRFQELIKRIRASKDYAGQYKPKQ